MKKSTVYLDMDGTIADLYGIENWLPRLRNEDSNIFLECRPMVSKRILEKALQNYRIVILSMTPKGATKEYCENVIAQKNAWLDKYFPFLNERIYRPYGSNKNLKNSKNAILIDDSESIRASWRGVAVSPEELWI